MRSPCTITIIILLGLTHHLHAQTPVSAKLYTKGTVIQGALKQGIYKGTPQSFSIVSPSGIEQTYKSAELTKVELSSGEVYEKFYISIETVNADYDVRKLADYSAMENALVGEVMVERLMEGPVMLYSFEDKYGYHHFFYKKEKDEAITLLPNRTYRDEVKLITYVDNSYKTVLQGLAPEKCSSEIKKQINRLDYNLNSFASIFQSINGCLGYTTSAKKLIQKKKDKVSFGLIAGLVSMQYSSYQRKFEPEAGFSFDVKPGYGLRKNNFSIAILYQPYQYTGDSVNYNTGKAKYELKLHTLNINSLMRHFFNTDMNSFFIQGGFNFRFPVYARRTYTYPSATGVKVSEEDLSGLQLGLTGGLGYEWNHIGLSANYFTVLRGKLFSYNGIDAQLKFSF